MAHSRLLPRTALHRNPGTRLTLLNFQTNAPDNVDNALRCRIEPFLDQAAPLGGAGPGVSAAAEP